MSGDISWFVTWRNFDETFREVFPTEDQACHYAAWLVSRGREHVRVQTRGPNWDGDSVWSVAVAEPPAGPTDEQPPEMSPETIAQLRELLAKATPGKWELEHGDIWVEKPEPVGYVPLAMEHTPADAALIVAAVNALPELLDAFATLLVPVGEKP